MAYAPTVIQEVSHAQITNQLDAYIGKSFG